MNFKLPKQKMEGEVGSQEGDEKGSQRTKQNGREDRGGEETIKRKREKTIKTVEPCQPRENPD